MIDIKAIRAAAKDTPYVWMSLLQPKTILALCDEIEWLRKDAARYQFMRRQTISHRERKQIMNAVDELCEEEMDAAIDAAMESKT